MKFLLPAFLIIPLLEIYLLIEIGSLIGAVMAIFLVVFTAFLGAVLVRAQGYSTLIRIRHQLDSGQLPAMEIFNGVVLFFAGALLLTPGFFTDTIGFILLMPLWRAKIVVYIIKRWYYSLESAKAVTAGDPDVPPGTQRVIDAEYRNID